VQRWWPVLLPVDAMDQYGNAKESFPSDVKITAEDGPLNQQFMLQVAGVGEYKFRLNDSRRPWAQQTVVFSELQVIDPSLWTLHPPIIDPKRLDLEAKRNQAYIKFARAHGYLPHEGAVEKEQADMATDTVLTQLLQQNKQLTDQVISKPAVVATPAPAPKSENGDAAVKAVVDFATAALNRPAPAVAPAADPMIMVRGMVDIIKEIKPAPDTSATDLAKQVVSQAEAANSRIYQLQKDSMDQMRAELKEAKAPPTIPAVAPPAPRTDVDVLQEMVTKQNLLKQLTGRGGSAAEEVADKPSNIDKWLEAAPLVAPIVQSIIQGMFQTIHYGLETWQKVAFNNTLAKNGQTTPTNMTPETKAAAEPSKPALTPEQQAQQQQFQLILQQVQTLIGPLNRALQNSKTGAEFAAMVIEFTAEGRSDYDKIRNVAESLIRLGMQVPGQPGIEQFKNAAAYLFQQCNPVFYQKVATLPTFGVFLEEFYEFDKIAAQEEAQDGQQ
jgi:hypothetical protein